MRRLPLLPVALLAGAVAVSGQAPPRLLVLVVVDQLRADYLTRFDAHWRAGFRTLLDEGAVFENTAYPYLNTVTCAGHATIGTGTFPSTHGMTGNAWWDRDHERSVACTADPDARTIVLAPPEVQEAASPSSDTSGSADEAPWGDSAWRLMVPTLADELRAQRPGARVVSLSLKARSAIGMAGHGGDAVLWFDADARSFVTSSAYADAPRPEVTAFTGAYPLAGEVGRAWSLLAPPGSYRQRDTGIGEHPPTPWSGRFPHRVDGEDGLDARFAGLWQTSPFADEYLERMTESLVEAFALGQRGTTDLLAVGFSALDLVGHAFGPESREVEDTLRRLDVTLGRLIDFLDARIGRAGYRLALSADHGVAPVAMSPLGGTIANEDVRERIEEALEETLGPLDTGSYVVAATGPDFVLAPGMLERTRGEPAARDAVVRALLDVPGVERRFWADDLTRESADPLARRAALSRVADRSGDLVVVPRVYWYFKGRASAGGATHGTPHAYDAEVPLVFFGGGVRAARHAEAATPADIAPTLASLAGLRLARAEGAARLP
jgi:predicted AlkP superfamily pyrophosphatase or phosphodiesterase